jgi:hypothetical protein
LEILSELKLNASFEETSFFSSWNSLFFEGENFVRANFGMEEININTNRGLIILEYQTSPTGLFWTS